MRELRFNPLTGQWVVVSSVRAQRRWRPRGFCPFCPGAEETGYGWDVLDLPNRFATLSHDAEAVVSEGPLLRRAQAYGFAGVIVETPQHDVKDLDELSLDHLTKVLSLWRSITEREAKDRRVMYLLIFRNKGEEIGVSLTHPHGQYFALPFVPLKPRLMLERTRAYMRRTGRCLVCDLAAEELRGGQRVIYRNDGFASVVPFFASWPFETHVYPLRHVQYITQLSDKELRLMADALRATLASLNALFERQMPYTLALFQAPFRGSWGHFHMHLQIYPALRDRDRLKYAAGFETATWDFTYDGVPEENAAMLRGACRRAVQKVGGLLGSCG
ncbi:MAG: galactose-1-phosphate uridylyltransferase [Acidilobus sp.]